MTPAQQVADMALQVLPAHDRDPIIQRYTGAAAAPTPERLLRRAQVADRLSCSLRLVDLLAARGALSRVRLPGRQRGGGFRETEVAALIAGNGGAP